jgi:heptosyltransferase-3
MDRAVNQILVLHPGSFGDTILSLPVLAALKHRYAPATLHLIGHPSLLDFLPGRSTVDAMSSIDGPVYRDLLCGPSDISPSVMRFFAQFVVVVMWVADDDGRVAAVLNSLKVPEVVVRSPGLREDSDRHATERFRETVRFLLPSEGLPETGLTPTLKDRRSAAQWLADHGIHPETDWVVAVHAGSGSLSKCWPSERFAAVIRELVRGGLQVILIEGPADAQVTDEVARQVQYPLPRLREAGLSMVAAVLSCCGGFLGNDSGVTQLATALGIPTVAVFGPTDPRIWGYRGKRLVPLRGEKECRCPTRLAKQVCNEKVWLTISPECVLSTLRQVVSSP